MFAVALSPGDGVSEAAGFLAGYFTNFCLHQTVRRLSLHRLFAIDR
jgi:hypothetical protein